MMDYQFKLNGWRSGSCVLGLMLLAISMIPDHSAVKQPAITGVASYYADKYHGKLTANGEIFDMHALTAAHPTYPFGTRVKVMHMENRRSVIVRINDRGPFVKGRVIDLSLAAAKQLRMVRSGLAQVTLEILP